MGYVHIPGEKVNRACSPFEKRSCSTRGGMADRWEKMGKLAHKKLPLYQIEGGGFDERLPRAPLTGVSRAIKKNREIRLNKEFRTQGERMGKEEKGCGISGKKRSGEIIRRKRLIWGKKVTSQTGNGASAKDKGPLPSLGQKKKKQDSQQKNPKIFWKEQSLTDEKGGGFLKRGGPAFVLQHNKSGHSLDLAQRGNLEKRENEREHRGGPGNETEGSNYGLGRKAGTPRLVGEKKRHRWLPRPWTALRKG